MITLILTTLLIAFAIIAIALVHAGKREDKIRNERLQHIEEEKQKYRAQMERLRGRA